MSPSKREHGEHGRKHHRRRLRRHHEPARVESVGEHAGEEPEHAEREELAEREDADGDRRSGQLEHEPRHRDVLHPGARDRDDLPREEEPVVAVLEARERPPVQANEGGRHGSASRSARNGSSASSIAASSSSSSVRSRAVSHAVRRERTSLKDALRLLSQLEPTRRPVSAGALRRAGRGRLATSRETCLDIAAGDTPSLAASSRTPLPGDCLIATSSETWPPVTPSGCTSRRSSRASWRSTGRSRFATGERIQR